MVKWQDEKGQWWETAPDQLGNAACKGIPTPYVWKPLNVDDSAPTIAAPVDTNQDSPVSRQTSTTGGQKDQKLARFSLIPPKVLFRLAEHYGRGAMKYAPRNWERGYSFDLSYDALHRHLNAWWSGIDKDEEGNDHIIAALWHVVALAHWSDDEKLKKMFDTRGKQE